MAKLIVKSIVPEEAQLESTRDNVPEETVEIIQDLFEHFLKSLKENNMNTDIDLSDVYFNFTIL